MSTPRHTPGPWLIAPDVYCANFVYALNDQGFNRFYLSVSGGHITSAAPLHSERTTKEEIEANAALIAAAPELLEALQNLENDDGSIPEHAWAMVQSAIAKATTLPTV